MLYLLNEAFYFAHCVDFCFMILYVLRNELSKFILDIHIKSYILVMCSKGGTFVFWLIICVYETRVFRGPYSKHPIFCFLERNVQ